MSTSGSPHSATLSLLLSQFTLGNAGQQASSEAIITKLPSRPYESRSVGRMNTSEHDLPVSSLESVLFFQSSNACERYQHIDWLVYDETKQMPSVVSSVTSRDSLLRDIAKSRG